MMVSLAQRGPESFMFVLPTIENDFINRSQITFVGRRRMPEDVVTFCNIVLLPMFALIL